MAMAAVGPSSTPYPFTRLSDRFGVYAVPMFDDNYGWLSTALHRPRNPDPRILSTPIPHPSLIEGPPRFPIIARGAAAGIVDATTGRCAAVDPGDAAPILTAVRALGLTLTTVLPGGPGHRHRQPPSVPAPARLVVCTTASLVVRWLDRCILFFNQWFVLVPFFNVGDFFKRLLRWLAAWGPLFVAVNLGV